MCKRATSQTEVEVAVVQPGFCLLKLEEKSVI